MDAKNSAPPQDNNIDSGPEDEIAQEAPDGDEEFQPGEEEDEGLGEEGEENEDESEDGPDPAGAPIGRGGEQEEEEDGGDGDLGGMEPPIFEAGLLKTLVAEGKVGPTPLHEAAREDDAEGLRDILENDEEWKGKLDHRDVLDYTPLHVACEHGSLGAVRALLEFVKKEPEEERRGAIVNAKCKFHSFTPLHFAAYHGHLDVMKALEKADLHAITDDKRTVLHLAAFRGHKAAVSYLISVGVDKEAADKDGDTAADIAASEEIRDLILEPPKKKIAQPEAS